jgi:hypothetical protein
MNKTILVIVGALVVIAVSVGLSFLVIPSKITVVDNNGKPTDVPVGALTGPDIPSTWLRVGGVTHYFAHMNGNTASTTLCSMKAPVATSTLISATVEITSGSSTAGLITIAKAASTSNNATTTILGNQILLTASTEDTINASTTAAQKAAEAEIFGPSTYLNIGIQHGTGLLNTQRAICNVEWQTTN